MTSLQFLQSILDWLLADPAHVVLAASVIAAVTPNPDPNSVLGKLYRVVDILALNILRAKSPASIPTVALTTPVQPTSGQPSTSPADTTKQAGFARGVVPQIVLVILGAVGLCACTAAQNAFTQANTQVVQAAMGAGKDEMTVGRELICGAPYQVVANAMADDAGVNTAVPALCPATKSVAVVLSAPKSVSTP